MSLPEENTNNQNPQPRVVSVARYPKDSKYYYLDGSGVFLVDKILFKIQATLIFGHRPASTYARQTGPLSPMYIEDIIPMLSDSNDHNPIELPGITATQFRDYLLILLGRPYDDEYLKLISSNNPTKHSKDLCMRCLDIATLARRFGMLELEEWATNVLHAIFAGAAATLARVASENWDSDTVLRLRAFTKATRVELPVLTFIQYLVSVGSKDENVATLGDHINDLPCVGLYRHFVASDTEPVLFGCAFLNILSLGHRSPVWAKCLTRNDRAVLYAAQVQLVDASGVLDLDLGWLSTLSSATSDQFCNECKARFSEQWDQGFGQCSKDLGSGYPLKDVLLLAQLPIYRHEMRGRRKVVSTSGRAFKVATCWRDPSCSVVLLESVNTHIQQVFIKAAAQYKKIVEEL